MKKIPTLRLFGIKTDKYNIRINDMQYLNEIGSVKITLPKNQSINEVAYNYIQSLGFKIIGKIDIPKYDMAFICESNPYSLVKLHNKNIKPQEIKMIQDITQLGVDNSPSQKEKFINDIKNNIERAFQEYREEISKLSSIDNFIYGESIEKEFLYKISSENNLTIIDKSPCGLLAIVNDPYNDFEKIKILVTCNGEHGERWAKLRGYK